MMLTKGKTKKYIPIKGVLWSSITALFLIEHDKKNNKFILSDGKNEFIVDQNSLKTFFVESEK